jgi:hypothetical protein
MSYIPASGTLPHRVCAYFVKHPEEELSAADVALKFDVAVNKVSANLSIALTHKLIERVRNGGAAWAYRGGPNLHKALGNGNADAYSAPVLPRPAFPTVAQPLKPRLKRPRLEVLDLSAVAIDADVPMPDKRSGVRNTDWPVLFERLTKPGLCSSPLPIEHRHSLKSAAEKWFKAHGGTFAIRVISDTHLRIWRTE